MQSFHLSLCDYNLKMASMSTGRLTLGWLQAGRGLAAVAVLLFHLSIMMGEQRYGGVAAFEAVTRFGNLGVDFFFVLSGFIILHAHKSDIGHPERVGEYLTRRLVRVWPIYWIYTAGFVVLVLLGGGNATTLPQTWQGWFTSIFLVRISPEQPPLTVAWTLVHEAAFYLVFTIILAKPRFGLPLFGVWMAICLGRMDFPDVSERTPANTYFAAYNLDFAFGMAARLLWSRLTPRSSFATFAAGSIGCAIVLAGLYGILPIPAPLFFVGLAFGLMIAGAAGIERHIGFAPPIALKIIGDASYTIYLVHLAIIGAVLKVLTRIDLPPAATFFVAATVAIMCGAVAYFIIERPVVRAFQRAVGGQNKAVANARTA
jgi:peptidoglycan/LPS O-acetylase OafA/YrhL